MNLQPWQTPINNHEPVNATQSFSPKVSFSQTCSLEHDYSGNPLVTRESSDDSLDGNKFVGTGHRELENGYATFMDFDDDNLLFLSGIYSISDMNDYDAKN